MKSHIIHQEEENKFILNIEDGGEAFLDYEVEEGVLQLVYSEVPSQYRGKGVGKDLVLKTFEKLTEEGYKAKAHCGYIKAIRDRSEKWKDIIA